MLLVGVGEGGGIGGGGCGQVWRRRRERCEWPRRLVPEEDADKDRVSERSKNANSPVIVQ